MSYRFELHCHTAEVSYCASCPAEQSVALLKSDGYDGVAITNHYYRDWFTTKQGSWKEKSDAWLTGYRLAKEAGEEMGLAVVLGVELGFDCCPNNHFLSFGMEESFFEQYPNLYEMTPADYWQLANRLHLYFGQAHPLRGDNFCHPEDPSILHGMEFYNGHGEHGNHNKTGLRAGQAKRPGGDGRLGFSSSLSARHDRDAVSGFAANLGGACQSAAKQSNRWLSD